MSIDQHFDGLLNQHQASIDKADSMMVEREKAIQAIIKEFGDRHHWMFDLSGKKVNKDAFFFELLGDSHSALKHQESLTKALAALLQGDDTYAAWQVKETLANMIAEKL